MVMVMVPSPCQLRSSMARRQALGKYEKWTDPRVIRWHTSRVRCGRFVARFDFRASRQHARAWLVSQDHSPRVCHDDLRFEVDLVVTSDVRTLHLVFAGRLAMSAALRDGSIALEGTMQARRSFT